MKKNYIFILISVFAGLNIFSQTLTKLSLAEATALAKQKKFNEIETAMLIERAMSTGVDLSPRRIPSIIPPAPLNSAANNLDFELQNFTGWTGSYTAFNCTIPTPNLATSVGTNFTTVNTTSNQTGICTAGNDPSVTTTALPSVCPYGGLASCRLGDVSDGCGSAYLSQTFLVSVPDTVLTLYYAVVLYDGHPAFDAPKFAYRIKKASGITIDSLYIDATQATAPGSGFLGAGIFGLYYKPWTSRVISLKNYIGQNLTIDFYTSDCNGGAHRGYAYIDCKFGIPCGSLSPASMCFVNTNTNLRNEVYFNRNNSLPKGSGTIIYRQNALSTWDSIGFVPYTKPDKFIDTTANPNQQAYTYCVAASDSCRTLYAKSALHKTIFLQSSLGTGTQVNLSWNAYIGATVGSYYIYRGATPSTLSLINQVSSSTLAYTDLAPPAGINYYKVNFKTPVNCTSNAPFDTLVGSNYKTNGVTAIGYFNTHELFSIYPNPGSTIMNLELRMQNGIQNTSYDFRMTNVLGEEIINTSKFVNRNLQIDISDLQNGVYFVTVKDIQQKTVATRKIIIQH